MDEKGEEFSFFFGSAVFLEYVFLVSVDEDISGFFVFAVAAADDGADLLEGVVGVFLEEEDGSVFDIPVEDSLTVGAEFLVLVLLVEESSAPGAGFVAGGGFAFPDFGTSVMRFWKGCFSLSFPTWPSTQFSIHFSSPSVRS